MVYLVSHENRFYFYRSRGGIVRVQTPIRLFITEFYRSVRTIKWHKNSNESRSCPMNAAQKPLTYLKLDNGLGNGIRGFNGFGTGLEIPLRNDQTHQLFG